MLQESEICYAQLHERLGQAKEILLGVVIFKTYTVSEYVDIS